MARTSETLTQTEFENFKRGCVRHNIIDDETNEASVKFGALMGEYIVFTWGQDITEHTFDVALQKLREAGHSIPFKSKAQIQYETIAAQSDPEQVNALLQFLRRQRLLVNTGDELFSNAGALLPQLRGREITSTTVQAAIGRAQYGGAQLYFTPGPEADRSLVGGKINHAAKSSEPFMPKSEVRSSLDQSYEHNPLRHKADPKSTPEPVLDSTEARWREMAQKLLRTGNSHGENAELEKCFNDHFGGSWRQTFEEMTAIKKDRQRRAGVGG
jgi:hypothetical protein